MSSIMCSTILRSWRKYTRDRERQLWVMEVTTEVAAMGIWHPEGGYIAPGRAIRPKRWGLPMSEAGRSEATSRKRGAKRRVECC